MVAIQQAQQAARMQAAVQVVQKVRKPSLALKTPVGKRAVTVMVDSLSAVGGLLNAGDFVDVIAQLNTPSQNADKKTVTAMIFQDLQVLAVNTNLNDPGAYDDQQAAAALKITFAVDPQEAGLLSFANKNGTLELALRSPDESDHKMVKADTWKTLADYVLKNQGLNIQDPDGDNTNKSTAVKPNIQIFRGGKEL
jgi:pilus assembly protein CpaB